jgi:hypothetical protein
MPDNITAPAAGVIFATDELTGGVHWPYAKLAFGPDNSATPVADANGARLPVKVGEALPAGTNNIGIVDLSAGTLAALETIELGAATLAALETITVTGPLTDAQLRAAAVPVSVAEPSARTLASNITLAAGAASTQITAVAAGSYIFEAVFTGADLQLQRLGPDGLTWINAGTLAASGSVGVVLAANDTLRLRNNSGGSITGLFARVA